MTTTDKPEFSLMVHGGSGSMKSIGPFRETLSEALEEGEKLLKAGKDAGEVAMRCIMIMEAHPRFNAGKGSALNELGEIEMEAAIMRGADLSVGAVAGLDRVAHPIQVADLVRQDDSLVKLIGDGAFVYALEHGILEVDNESLITDRSRDRFENWKKDHGLYIDGDGAEQKLGTVGTVVVDRAGNLAAGTSTGGLTGKKVGRVGDTSTIGAGTYANAFGAISATGRGEDFVRLHTAGTIASLIEQGYDAKEAARKAVSQLDTIGGRGGVIVVDKDYNIGSAKTQTSGEIGLVHGAVTSEREPVVSLDPEEVTPVSEEN